MKPLCSALHNALEAEHHQHNDRLALDQPVIEIRARSTWVRQHAHHHRGLLLNHGCTRFAALICPGRYPALGKIREGIGDGILVRKDIKNTAALEGCTHNLLVEAWLDVDAAMGDAIVFRRWRCKTLGTPLGRGADRRGMDGNGRFVIHPQHTPGIN